VPLWPLARRERSSAWFARPTAGRSKQLADRSGYSQAIISRVERGVSRAARDTAVLTDLADVLGVPPAVLGITSDLERPPTLEDVKRRNVLEGATGLAVTVLLPQNVATPARINAAEVTQCWSALHRLYQLDDHHGGGTLCQLTEGMARRLQDAIRRGSYSLAVGRVAESHRGNYGTRGVAFLRRGSAGQSAPLVAGNMPLC
jgi:transcriptional regulator with XRE-family HTH domain